MKIIVNNEREKELLQRFIEMLNEDTISIIEEFDHSHSLDEVYLSADDYDFIRDGFNCCDVVDDSKEKQLYIEHHNIVGVCSICNSDTSGTIDGNDISYWEWLDMCNSDKSEWKCETCYFKE